MRSWAYNGFGVLMGTSWRASCLRWPSWMGDSWPMITLFLSQGDFCATALDVSSCSNLCGIQLQLPQAHHQQPVEGPQLAFLEDRTGPIREYGKLLAQAPSAGHTVEALQSVVAPFTRRDRIA